MRYYDDKDNEWKFLEENSFGGLGPMNTIADFISELCDATFRDILGSDTMDRAIGSFDKQELFQVMSKIFLSSGKILMQAKN